MSNLYIINKDIINLSRLNEHYSGCFALDKLNNNIVIIEEFLTREGIDSIALCTSIKTKNYHCSLNNLEFISIRSGWAVINESTKSYLNKRYISDGDINRKRGLHMDIFITNSLIYNQGYEKLFWIEATRNNIIYDTYQDILKSETDNINKIFILSNELTINMGNGSSATTVSYKGINIGSILKSGYVKLKDNRYRNLLKYFNIPIAKNKVQL